MDHLDSMSEARSILDNSQVIHNSRPPLRWIANLAGSIASKNILKLSYMEDEGIEGFKYKYYGWLWDTFWPIYQKYGTFYKLDIDSEFGPREYHGQEWDSSECICSNCTDDEHCPGCVECESDFEDEETGDAFRIL